MAYASRHERGYGVAWDRLRLHILRRDLYLCQECRRNDRARTATDVDHIKPKKQGGTDDWGNLQSLCRQCHIDKTARENGRAEEIGADGWPVG